MAQVQPYERKTNKMNMINKEMDLQEDEKEDCLLRKD